ncbi:MAG TPA: potassium/proton antiporter [Candidatus Nanopelagicales bacterium]
MDVGTAAWVSLIVGVIVLAAIAGVRVADRFGLPGLLFYLILGLLLGSDGPGGIPFDDAQLATVLGWAALVVILAEGGLTTRPATVRPVLAPALVLASVGVAISIAVVALPLHWLAGVDMGTAILIGAVLAPTDAAAVFTVARRLHLPPRLQTVLEAESGFNDAPVVVLVVLLTTGTAQDWPWWLVAVVVVAELVGGVLVGGAMGLFARWMLPRLALPAAGLYPVAVIALFMLTYGLAVVLHTSGFAAVYLLALILAASPLPHRRAVLGFVEGLAWTVQIGLFVMLGLLAFPSRLGDAVGLALIAGVVLLVLARPLSVLVSLAPFTWANWLTQRTGTTPMPWRWVGFTSWAGLRGAVPIIFATIPLGAGDPDGELIFDVTLLLVIVLTLVQAPTMGRFASGLGLSQPDRAAELTVEAAPLDTLRAALLDLDVGPGSRLAGTYVGELPLPRGAVVSLVVRGGHSLAPDRATRIRVGDRLLVVTTESSRAATEQALRSVSRSGRLADWAGGGVGDDEPR